MLSFRDVYVIPPSDVPSSSQILKAEPIWPSFDKQTTPRHFFRGKPIDLCPQFTGSISEIEDLRSVWVGHLRPHFGHLVAEHLTRLPMSVKNYPQDSYIFVPWRTENGDWVPDFFWDLLAWYGLSRHQVKIITKPILFREIVVAPQGEHLPQGGPDEAYLALLDSIEKRNNLLPIVNSLLYVSRLGIVRRGGGGHLGESYLCEKLAELGVRLLDPSVVSLQSQLALYAGANHIIFAEGSALHGRQLLGKKSQEITVLNRRPRKRLAQASLISSCDRLVYEDLVLKTIEFEWPDTDNGIVFRKARSFGLTIFDIERLFTFFESVGVPLGSLWNNDAYEAACLSEASDWLRAWKIGSGDQEAERASDEISRFFQSFSSTELLRGFQDREST